MDLDFALAEDRLRAARTEIGHKDERIRQLLEENRRLRELADQARQGAKLVTVSRVLRASGYLPDVDRCETVMAVLEAEGWEYKGHA